MPLSRNRASRFLTTHPARDLVPHNVSNFYREEVVRCQRCLDQQREFYSERAIQDVERALLRVMSKLDHLCTASDADRVVSQLLRQFNVSSGLFTWSDPRQVH
jgi:hypothetical protein